MSAPVDFERLCAEVDACEAARWTAEGYTHERDKAVLHERRDFWALDIGGSGAFMLRKADGAVFGIKAYGSPDYAKGVGYAHELTGAEVIRCRWARPGQFGMRRDMREVHGHIHESNAVQP
jgi:hypothetical protein